MGTYNFFLFLAPIKKSAGYYKRVVRTSFVYICCRGVLNEFLQFEVAGTWIQAKYQAGNLIKSIIPYGCQTCITLLLVHINASKSTGRDDKQRNTKVATDLPILFVLSRSVTRALCGSWQTWFVDPGISYREPKK